ncbi:MAG: hypothetical protein H2172_10490 [Opitutus sp.]|nr:hypothetical protein [Opitutus sp.]MCS6276779.1 hypothetical protein [Opitutus sp.]MCS6301572.1 hypothetical protein [Opitutus sp.]
MMSVIGLMLALGLLAAARFCVRPARTYRAWWVALVATELGHVGVVLALGLAIGAWRCWRRTRQRGGGWGWLRVLRE